MVVILYRKLAYKIGDGISEPYYREIVKSIYRSYQCKVKDILAKSVLGIKSLRAWSFQERAIAMQRAANILEDRADTCAKTMALEMGKTYVSALVEVKKCVDVCRYYADHAHEHLADEYIQTEALKTYRCAFQIGTILEISLMSKKPCMRRSLPEFMK